jgi:hypothetical protein
MTTKMTRVLDEYANANNFSVIFDVSNPNTPVLYISNLIDITREIIALYDKEHPVQDKPAAPAKPPATAPAKPPATAPATKKQP